MTYGKTIELLLVDGKADGTVTAELSNWDGKAIRIPRDEVKKSKVKEITDPGVYFLFCEEKKDKGKKECYIGQAENIQKRLKRHISDFKSKKEHYYWATAICFTSKQLNKALMTFIENELVIIAKKSENYKILTKKTEANHLKETDKPRIFGFIENSKLLVKFLGYNIFPDETPANSNIFYCTSKKKAAYARGYTSQKGFTVKKGARFASKCAPCFKKHNKGFFALRNELLSNGAIDKKFVLKRNYEFPSPSAASSIILGRPSNGTVDWKKDDGTMLKDS